MKTIYTQRNDNNNVQVIKVYLQPGEKLIIRTPTDDLELPPFK